MANDPTTPSGMREVLQQAVELKPCPFCGGEAVPGCEFGLRLFYYFGQCKVCGARGQSFPEDEGGGAAAAAAWNRRWELPKSMVHRLATQMGWTPPQGNAGVRADASPYCPECGRGVMVGGMCDRCNYVPPAPARPLDALKEAEQRAHAVKEGS